MSDNNLPPWNDVRIIAIWYRFFFSHPFHVYPGTFSFFFSLSRSNSDPVSLVSRLLSHLPTSVRVFIYIEGKIPATSSLVDSHPIVPIPELLGALSS